MKSRLAFLSTVGLLLTACVHTQTTKVTEADVINKHWQLVSVNDQAVTPMGNKLPQIHIDSTLNATGIAGCNNFFGQAEWQDGQLRIEKMGMTMMMCPPPLNEIEQDITATLSNWSTVTLEQNRLILQGAEHTLTYQQAE
ncbi:META domain-containing protein [Motilimonas cestriensis]|uniref:META domain-containing protein n=1 Tax=Motilimonas cestriensis TaxID=2742685 RepID=A0ABS8WB61_9GAMM|nr:META domain-containing protein [Motilimonas cestriensis]MCE2594981.1 META domain-containing protein [Motilimonas cestriensis]